MWHHLTFFLKKTRMQTMCKFRVAAVIISSHTVMSPIQNRKLKQMSQIIVTSLTKSFGPNRACQRYWMILKGSLLSRALPSKVIPIYPKMKAFKGQVVLKITRDWGAGLTSLWTPPFGAICIRVALLHSKTFLDNSSFQRRSRATTGILRLEWGRTKGVYETTY